MVTWRGKQITPEGLGYKLLEQSALNAQINLDARLEDGRITKEEYARAARIVKGGK